MRVLCLSIPHLPLQVEERDSGITKDEMVIIGGLPHERRMVYDASPQAMSCGIETGMPLRHAYSLCPDAHFIRNHEKKYELAFEEVLEILDGFSPLVEKRDLGLAFLDASGLDHYYNGEENLVRQLSSEVLSSCGLAASVAVADNKFISRTATSLISPGEFRMIAPGSGKRFLAHLPVDVLPCSKELRRQLYLLGVKTVGKVADLGSEAMMAQFGQEGELVHRLACVGETIDSLCAQLKERWQLCQRLELSLRCDNGYSQNESLDLKMPTCSRKALLSLLRLRLEQTRFERPVCGVEITLSGFCKNGRQLLLPIGIMQKRQQIALAARDIRNRMGRDVIKRPVIVDEKAFLPERRFALGDIEI
ncbi:MAG: hypothetical protein NTU41_10620 [Chloroflexi bacterium]|nr:hypothetical protein [Chloroflexota bacterium]